MQRGSYQLEKIREKISQKSEFDTAPYSKKFIRRKVTNRMRSRNIDSMKDYFELLEEEPAEHSKLIKTISVSVTEFFRDEEIYEDFRNVVIPQLEEYKREKGHSLIRVWSVGCASGEEPYSIAISLKEALGSRLDDFLPRIHATDIDEEALERAEKGVYLPEDVEEVPEGYLEKYFDLKDGKYRIDENLKKMVRFKKHNIISDEPYNSFDIVFCRNMLIYFSQESHKEIHMQLYESLRDDGYLIIGNTECLKGQAKEKFDSVANNNRIFQKKSKPR